MRNFGIGLLLQHCFFWGIGMAMHAWKVFGTQFFFSKKWEEEQIEKYIKEEEFERQKWE